MFIDNLKPKCPICNAIGSSTIIKKSCINDDKEYASSCGEGSCELQFTKPICQKTDVVFLKSYCSNCNKSFNIMIPIQVTFNENMVYTAEDNSKLVMLH